MGKRRGTTTRSSSSSSSNSACRRVNNGFINKAKSSSPAMNFCYNKTHLLGGGGGGGGRRPRRGFDDQDERTDRLSVLPDDIIHHIFSYLETPVVVQTSVLSRRWRHLWTTCPYLKFNWCSAFFLRPQRPLSFDKFVTNVLSYRNHDSPLQKVQASTTYYTDYSGDGTEDDDPSDPVLDSILDYAISHSVTHISLSFVYGDPVPQQLSACKTLKTLSLCGFYVHEESLRSLSLTALHLCGDAFSGYSIDPFNACPNLKNLSLQGCSLSRTKFLKISAPQLVELKIEGLIGAEASYIDIDAPNLRTFIYAHTPRLNFSSINFPNLEYADITYLRHKDEKKEDCLSLFGLFQWLHQAQFLVLDSGRHDSGVVDALSVVLNKLENQSSPFHRLKILKLNRSNISPKVMSYLCNSSPHAEIKLLELPKVEH